MIEKINEAKDFISKITNNQNVKRDLVSKIGYLLINNESVLSDKTIINIFSSYKDNKNIYYKNDNFFKFIILLLKHKNTDLVEDFSINETDHFDLIDFIFDYYEWIDISKKLKY